MTEDTRGVVTDDAGHDTLHTGASGPSLVDDANEAPADSDLADDANTSLDDIMAKRKSEEEATRPLTLPPVGVDLEKIGDKRLVNLAIEASPDPLYEGRHLPATRFADDIAECDERTVRRYQDGSRALNKHFRNYLLARLRRAQKLAEDPRMTDPVAAWKAVRRVEAKQEP